MGLCVVQRGVARLTSALMSHGPMRGVARLTSALTSTLENLNLCPGGVPELSRRFSMRITQCSSWLTCRQ